jgi:hypothetical protein
MNEYFSPPTMCQSKGGAYNFVCEHHAVRTGHKSVCLYEKQWKRIGYKFKCPNKEWQESRLEITQ